MTVHRVGPAQETAPHRTNLGRVLVTIDDLKALVEFLTRDREGMAAKIHVEFDGGYFTEAEELRTLSDIEMKSLRLKTQRVEVVLSPSDAFAVGDRQEADDVYRVWARARQTTLTPLRWWTYLVVMGLIIAALLATSLVTFIVGSNLSSDDPFHPFVPISGSMLSVIGVLIGILV